MPFVLTLILLFLTVFFGVGGATEFAALTGGTVVLYWLVEAGRGFWEEE